MAKATRTKRNAPLFPVPQSRDQANEAIREIGVAQRELARIEANMNDELAAVREKFEATATPMRDAIAARIDGVQVWAAGAPRRPRSACAASMLSSPVCTSWG